MRYLNILLAMMMLLFIAVQYNDPDGVMWMFIYLVPTFWALFAAFKPSLLRQTVPGLLLAVSIVLSIGLMVYYWPTSSGWWKQEIWWEVETAREGMGMMIVTGVLFVAWLTSRMTKLPESIKSPQ